MLNMIFHHLFTISFLASRGDYLQRQPFLGLGFVDGCCALHTFVYDSFLFFQVQRRLLELMEGKKPYNKRGACKTRQRARSGSAKHASEAVIVPS